MMHPVYLCPKCGRPMTQREHTHGCCGACQFRAMPPEQQSAANHLIGAALRGDGDEIRAAYKDAENALKTAA